ncbi:MAG: hypothetical protein ACYTF5_06170 [Planctomycetota bacterium]
MMFAMPLSAQAASYTYIDQKAPYKNPGMLTALNLPRLGTTFQLQVPGPWFAGGPPSRLLESYFYYLAFGVSNPNASIPALGGFLFTSADIVVPTYGSGQPMTMSFPIPNSPALLGVRFYNQVGELWTMYQGIWHIPIASSWRLSRGGLGVIGK